MLYLKIHGLCFNKTLIKVVSKFLIDTGKVGYLFISVLFLCVLCANWMLKLAIGACHLFPVIVEIII